MPQPEERLLRQYLQNRITPEEALKRLQEKSLSDGFFYYIGRNKFDGWIEIFKATEPRRDFALSVEEIEAELAEKGLYIFCSPGGWMTIRKVPKNADNVLPLREPDEEAD